MKGGVRVLLGKTVWSGVAMVLQIFGGLLLGIIVVVALPAAYSFAADLGLVPGKWHCSTRQINTVEYLNIHFDVDVQECVAGVRFAQTKTAIRASREGDSSPTKVFEYVVPHKSSGEPAIVQIDAHTVRISMPGGEGPGREILDARYIGLGTWGDLTFVYR